MLITYANVVVFLFFFHLHKVVPKDTKSYFSQAQTFCILVCTDLQSIFRTLCWLKHSQLKLWRKDEYVHTE